MLLVNNPGSWSSIFPPLRHAAWNGWTPTDLIFPFFLFIVGITTSLSLDARRERGESEGALVAQILRRAGVIILLGLLVGWFPFFTWGPVQHLASAAAFERVVDRLLHLRIPGVLQRIGVVYAIAALVSLRTTARQQAALIAAILIGYWAALSTTGWDVPAATLAARIDRALLDWGVLGNHLWAETKTWDPEGPLSTVPAVATCLLGVLAGRWIRSRRPLAERINGMFVAGAIGTVTGLMWNWVLPINKNLWTSSYVVFSAGVALLCLAVCMWWVDVRGATRWTRPFLVFGTNPIVAFVGSDMLARLIYSVTPAESAVYRALYVSWLPSRLASLAFALSIVLAWLAALTVLYRRRIFLKV
jgi:predicted acyltransferase